MLGLFLKKTLFDYLDNFLLSLIFNAIFVASVAGLFLLNYFAIVTLFVTLSASLFVGNIIYILLIKIVYNLRLTKKRVVQFVIYNLVLLVMLILLKYVYTIYFKSSSIIYTSIGFLYIWILITLIALGYIVYTIIFFYEESLVTIIMYSFIYLFKNIILIVPMVILSLILLISNLLFVPGIAGFAIALRNLIYLTHIQLHNRESKEDLTLAIENEKSILQGRKLRHIIFPWRE